MTTGDMFGTETKIGDPVAITRDTRNNMTRARRYEVLDIKVVSKMVKIGYADGSGGGLSWTKNFIKLTE
jgi:hypothetical protein